MVSLFFIALFGTMIPGASFVITVRNSLCGSRICGLATAFGLAGGMAFHAVYILPSLYWFKHNSGNFLTVITMLGATYLFYFGVTCLRAQPKQAETIDTTDKNIRPSKAFWAGLLTDMLNPKIVIFLTALLSQYIGETLSSSEQLKLGLMLVLVQLIWFASVALLFSAPKLQKTLYSYAHWIERISGVLLIGVSLNLVVKYYLA